MVINLPIDVNSRKAQISVLCWPEQVTVPLFSKYFKGLLNVSHFRGAPGTHL
jgi:hypothetical protein